MFQPGLQCWQVFRIGNNQRANRFIEAGRVGHEIAQGDGFAVARRNLEIQIAVDVRVEVELALLDQLHHRRPGEQLGNRSGPEESALGIDRFAGRDVGVTVTFRQQHLSILNYDHNCAGHIAPLQGIRCESIEPCFDVGFS